MFEKLKTYILFAALLFALAASMLGQKRNEIKPPPETASLAENQQWVVGTIGKYGSYKTRVEAITLSNAKFDGCAFSVIQVRKLGSTSTTTMGPTRTTYSAKDDILIDVTKVRPDGISLEDHLYPELHTVRFWYSGFDLDQGSANGSVYYIVVKQAAAEALKTAFVQIQRFCKVPNQAN